MCLMYFVLLFDYFITHQNDFDQTNRTVLPDTIYASGVTSLYFLCVTCMTNPQKEEPELRVR